MRHIHRQNSTTLRPATFGGAESRAEGDSEQHDATAAQPCKAMPGLRQRALHTLVETDIWRTLGGRSLDDRLMTSDAYDCSSSFCGSHVVGDRAAVAQQEQQAWAAEMHDFLLDLHDSSLRCRVLRLTPVPH